LYAVQIHRESSRAACQASYNAAFATQLTERAKLSSASDKAQSDLLFGVSRLIAAPPTQDPKAQAKRSADFRQLFVKFEKAAEQVEQARKSTPLPAFPNC
jgi:hypothetical protein